MARRSKERGRRIAPAVLAVFLLAAGLAVAQSGVARAVSSTPLPSALSNEGLVTSFSPSTLVSSAWNPTNEPGNCPTVSSNAGTVNRSGWAEIDTTGAAGNCEDLQSPSNALLSTAPGTTYEAKLNFSSFQDWPAFWMYGQNWPAGGEIDAVEGGPGSSTVTWHQSGSCSGSSSSYTIGPDPWDCQQVSLATGHPADIAAGAWTTVDISFTSTGVDVYYNGSLYIHIPETITTSGNDPMYLVLSEGSCDQPGYNACSDSPSNNAPAGSVQAQYVSDYSTSAKVTGTAPAAVTSAASGVTATAATLNGSVNPEGAATTYQFQYGTTNSYGSVSPSTAASAGSGTSAVAESSALTGLSASTTYHYRIAATNADGTTYGADLQLTTSSAASWSCTTTSKTGVCPSSGTYNGSLTAGSNQDTVAVADISSPGSVFRSQTLQANSASSWQVTPNIAADNTAFVGYPQVQDSLTNPSGSSVPLADYSSLASSFATSTPSSPGSSDDWAAGYAIWLGSSSQGYVQQINVWNEDYGYTPSGNDIQTWTDPSGTVYNLWANWDTGTMTLVRQNSTASGSVNIYALLEYLTQNGFGNNVTGINQVSYGFLLASTSGQAETFGVSGFTLAGHGDGKNGAPS